MEQSEKKNLIINVKDTGRGIHQTDLPHIFDRFYQTKYLNGSPQEGTGIGLAISHKIMSRLGGRIWVESESGVGSDFRFTLPLRPNANQDSQVSAELASQS